MQNMTSGKISLHLIKYAIPMILGNIMQLTYNAVDSVIIGKCLGETALAAVSTSGPIMTIMVLGASGIGIGASVIMSRYYGAGDRAALKREFSTTVIFSTVFSLVVFAVGMVLNRQILTWINTPAEVMEQASLYLRIMMVGFLFTFQYNILSHAMRSIGDSRTPVLFLGISCGLNIVLDLLLVAVLDLGVAGAAVATVCSILISVVLCILWIRRRIPELALQAGEWVVDTDLLRQTLQSGLLTALQQAAQPVGKVMIQSVINAQGTLAIGAFNAVCRVDDFACIPAQSIGSGIMTCTAQNRGAGLTDRMKQSLRSGLGIALCYFPLICGCTLLLKSPVIRLLCPDESAAMVEMGISYLRVKAWMFVMPCVTNSLQGYLRGLGRMSVVLFATVLQISIRAVCVALWVPRIGIVGEAWACFTGWAIMIVFEVGYLVSHKGRFSV